MSHRPVRGAATVIAFAVLVGAVAVAAGGSTRSVSRPVRALGANGDAADAAVPGVEGGRAADPVDGEIALPHRSRALERLTHERSGRVPWVVRELRLDAGGEEEGPPGRTAQAFDQPDGALQAERGGIAAPVPDLNVRGMASGVNPDNVTPPDTNGDVGNGYFLQMVNTAFAVYDADDGSRLGGPFLMSSLFDPVTQRLCETRDDGDPVVLYDEHAGRWLISQFALDLRQARFAECVAISESGDPLGAWYAYQFDYPKSGVINDYPKLGVWPAAGNSAYFASFNQFRCTVNVCDFAWRGVGAVAYERDAMLAGEPAGQIYVDLYQVDDLLYSMLPSDADSTAPPAAEPNYFVQFDANEWDYPDDALEIWEFDVDWTDPGSSTFAPQTTQLPTANFNPWPCTPGRLNCVPQRDTTVKLDTLADRLMFRLQYRNYGAVAGMVVTHTVRAPGPRSGVRWYQLEDTGAGGDWAIVDQGTYAPGTLRHRWMSSAATDALGNMAIGYSISSARSFPSIAIAGQTAGVTGSLDLAERRVWAGTGSEAPSATTRYNRWGDYANLSVAQDGCTFYLTTQYYRKTGQWKWGTRIIRFQLDPAACIT